MALFPINADERAPVGIWPIQANTAFQGGHVVQVVGQAADPTKAEIRKYGDANLNFEAGAETYGYGSALTSTIGLFDDSTTGRGYGTLFGHVIGLESTELSGGDFAGPATTKASGKGTIWLHPGLYLTDYYDQSRIDQNTEIGTALFASDATLGVTTWGSAVAAANATGILTTFGGITQGLPGDVKLATFLGFVDDELDLLASRVTPKPSSDFHKFILFAFK